MKAPNVTVASSKVTHHTLKAASLLLALLFQICGFTATAMAAPGDLDLDFGTGGRVIFDYAGNERWDKLLSLPNGDIFVVGTTGSETISKQIVKLNSSGELVTAFGNQGKVTVNLGSLPGLTTDSGVINDLIALPGGKILAVVYQSYTLSGVNRCKFSLIRLQSNGILDSTFGGDGIVEIDTLQSNIRWIIGADLDPAGRIVIVGSLYQPYGVAVMRLTPDGYLDTTFSADGIANHYLAPGGVSFSMAIQSDSKILVAGYVNSGVVNDDNNNLMVCRVLPDGNLDSSFATGGKLVMDLHGGPDIANAICIRPNGKIVVAGVTRTQPGNNDEFDNSLFVGLDQNGALDASFGSAGVAEPQVSGLLDQVISATLMPDGRIIANCRVQFSSGYQSAALRLMPNGTLDPTFAAGGLASINAPDSAGAYLSNDLSRDASGGFLVIGSSNTIEGQRGILVRLKGDPDTDSDGVVDASETNTGIYISPFDTGTNPNNRDTDSDGLSDGEEAYQYLTNPLVADSDNDGFLDGYEVLTGKSPLNILDKPALVAEVRTAIEFSFPSAIGKSYRIEDSLDLTTWLTVESGIAGTGCLIQRFYSTRNVPKRHFRVEENGP